MAVREEMAETLCDAVLRRLDMGAAGPPDPSELAVVAASMARELGWGAAREQVEQAALSEFFARRGGSAHC